MKKKDYELIANAINGVYDYVKFVDNKQTAERTLQRVINELAELLQAKNPHFQRDTFLKACGIGNEIRVVKDSEHSKEYLEGEQM